MIEVIGTSVQQQLAIVFAKGGGAATEIDFGTVYYGQMKQISAFLVNNGPNKTNYKLFFHPDKDPTEINENDIDFTGTPYEAGIELSQRILSADPLNGVINSYEQVIITNIIPRFLLCLNARLIYRQKTQDGEKKLASTTKSYSLNTQN